MALLSKDGEAREADRGADVRRYLVRLVTVVGIAVLTMLGLVWYLWAHSPKPP